MCGILGIVGRRTPQTEAALRIGTRTLAHRGPDDEGVEVFPHPADPEVLVGLGTRRLAILDLSSAGHMPMKDPATGNWIVMNGEIYNFRDLRRELERLGHRFNSTGDTEVALKSYGEWGEDCADRFRGMFAFAIWDAGRERLFMARDPLGVKPLYYAELPGKFVFASEVRAFLKSGLVNPKVDRAAAATYLAFGAVQEPLTIVESVRALPAGCSMVWEKGRITIRRYWSLVEAAARGPETDDPVEAGRRIRELLLESVALRLISDVPVALFLSGGIDSSAVLALASETSEKPLDTFSVTFDDEKYNESPYSELVAKRFGSRHHEIRLTQPQLLNQLPQALSSMDQPSIDGVNTYVVSGAARAAGVKVALSGIGGDELFAGYSTFHSVPRMNAYREVARWLQPLGKMFTSFPHRATSNGRSKLWGLASGDFLGENPYFLARALFLPSSVASLCGSRELLNGSNLALSQLRDLAGRLHGLDPVQKVSVLEASAYMGNTLLRDMDVMSMAHGLELRDPLLDRKLWEFVLPLRKRMKVRRDLPKPLLLNAVLEKMPAKVYKRPKRGFELPYEHWLRGTLRPDVERSLLPNGKSSVHPLEAAETAKVWRNFLDGKTSWSRPWSLFVLKQWIRQNLSLQP